MSSIKNYYYEEFISYEDSGMEEYEMYLLYQKLYEKYEGKTKEEVLEFFQPLMEEEEV